MFQTCFGWVIAGTVSTTGLPRWHTDTCCVSTLTSDDLLRRFLEIENCSLGQRVLSLEERTLSTTCLTTTQVSGLPPLDQESSYSRLKRITAWVFGSFTIVGTQEAPSHEHRPSESSKKPKGIGLPQSKSRPSWKNWKQ